MRISQRSHAWRLIPLREQRPRFTDPTPIDKQAFRARIAEMTAAELPVAANPKPLEAMDPEPSAAASGIEPLGAKTQESKTQEAETQGNDNGARRKKRKRQIARTSRIDKSVLAIPELRRYRDKGHLRFVASHPCLVCGRSPADVHHLRFAQPATLGRKVSDEFTVPLCRTHHRDLHHKGNELGWWQAAGIDALAIAQ